MKRTVVVLIILLAAFLAACSSATTQTVSEDAPGQTITVAGGAYKDISVVELQRMLEADEFPLVNVHIPFEGDLPDTDLSIPFHQIENHLDQLPADKDARIVLYCRSGRMSSIAAETLVDLGYTDVYNLEGGFIAWEQAGLPVLGE
jgi:rhodanese-related sulfurtransferase